MHNLTDLWQQLLAPLNYPKPIRMKVLHLHAIGWVGGESHVRRTQKVGGVKFDYCLPSEIEAVAIVDWSEYEP